MFESLAILSFLAGLFLLYSAIFNKPKMHVVTAILQTADGHIAYQSAYVFDTYEGACAARDVLELKRGVLASRGLTITLMSHIKINGEPT